jgi:hypothetical protein
MKHDIVFIGHVCLDRLIPYEWEEQVGLGSAVYYGSMAAVGVDCSVGAITRMHPDDAGRSDGVLAHVAGKEYFEPFTNRSSVGRNGRGDTTFAGYMAWRLEHGPAEALKFAAALASIKMEKVGPFTGSLEDVLTRMSETDF